MRRWVPIAVFVALATVAAVALAQVGGPPRARAAAIATSGSFEVSNSAAGQPIFSAAGIAPGGSAQGTVAIEDTGSGPVTLDLRRGALEDVPGRGGGLLSGRLRLTVLELSGPAAARTLYEGPLDSMPNQSIGRLAGGEARTFQFIATLPEGGSPSFQNAVQGASTTVAYAWIATEAEEERGKEPPASPDGGGKAPNGGGGAPGGGHSGSEGNGGIEFLRLTVPKIQPRLRGGHILGWAICDQTCRIFVRGRIRASGAGEHRGARIHFSRTRSYAPGGQRVRIPIPHTVRRFMRETPGRERVRAWLRFIAVGVDGQRDVIRKTVRLRNSPKNKIAQQLNYGRDRPMVRK
jgi:hypothetical protein